MIYDATGRKLQKIVRQGTSNPETYRKTYLGLIEFLSLGGSGTHHVDAIYHQEGRVYNMKVHQGGTEWQYEYFLKDHLGNVRDLFIDNNGSAQKIHESHYYPFGMELFGPWSDESQSSNHYRYNGKEFQSDFELGWYDYGARFYDPAIGRFTSVDPMANVYPQLSPYNYVANNPINYIDPDGAVIGDGKDIFNVFRESVNNRISSLSQKAENFNSKADAARAAGKDKKGSRLERRAGRASASAAAYGAVASELNALESSDQVYNLYTNAGGGVSHHAGGSTSYNTSTGAIDIKLKGGYNSNYLSHELKHAFQFETGRISFKSSGSIGDLYDLIDEQEAYQRGSLFGETRNPSLTKLASDYPAIKNNTTQRTLDTKAPFSNYTYREIFKMRAAANGGKGVSIKDIYRDPKN